MSGRPSGSGSQSTTSKLDLHHLPDDKPVFSCQKCSEVVVSIPALWEVTKPLTVA